ncbi:hypothetical protein [Pseudotenacibaculum haliotis]|uniref:Uncharacterized protein n=1 Tax=Pseudotenacibaculum haliotis TaxID=1862138 RepID=A0ABW5LQL3_9FLAO
MQFWTELYKELATKITENLNQIEWVDLWHNQINFLEEEHPFPTPAVFLSFRSRDLQDTGNKVQQVTLQVDCFLYYETLLDTHAGAYNQDGALNFIESLDHLYALFHGSSGNNYSSMRRLAFNPVDTGNAGNLYQLSFECVLVDYSAMKEFVDGQVKGVEIDTTTIEREIDDNPIFRIP